MMVLLFFTCQAESATIQVKRVMQSWHQNVLLVEPKYNIESSEVIDDAINNGIELTLIAKLQINKKRGFWFDEVLSQQHQTYQIRYFSLSGQYQLHDLKNKERHSFVLLEDLWGHLAQKTKFTLQQEDLVNGDYLSLRLKLDAGALPSALQLPVLLSADWTFKSDQFESIIETKP